MSAQLKMGFKLAQKLKMNPQLQQSIKMLSLPLMELEQAVREEMLENPVLEEVQDIMEEQTQEELSNKEEMPERHTWMEYTDFGSASSVPRRSLQKGGGSGVFNMENVVSTEQSLYDHIIWQIQMSGFSNQEKAYLNLLVDYLDEDGYLKNSLEEVSVEVNVPLEDLQKALALMHTLDPSGVGARDLKECLLIQARQNQEDTSDLVMLIENHLPNIEKRNFNFIAEEIGLDVEEVMDICKIISAMEPKPGRRFISQPVQYVIPDVYVTKERDDYRVTLNEEGLPHLRVVGMYQQMLRDSLTGKNVIGTDDSTQRYLRHKMNSALWLIRSLNQRQRTIFKVTSAIVRHQNDFFDKGPIGMKPLILQQIAEDIELHISTVSRVTTNKYVHTPHGVYELKYFFNIGIDTDKGTQISVEVVKLKILSYIKDEDKDNPVSDQEIIESLKKDLGVHLSRRTISKYRESMSILPSRSRRNL